MINCLDCKRPLEFKHESRGHTRCYYCHLQHKYEPIIAGFKIVNFKRRLTKKKERKERNRFKCTMGYASCESRGYCNGDC